MSRQTKRICREAQKADGMVQLTALIFGIPECLNVGSEYTT